MPIKNNSQVLIITTFAIILTAGIVYVMLLPVLSSLKSLRETTDSYQAIANAESGLEVEFYAQSKGSETAVNQELNNWGCRDSHREEDKEYNVGVGESKGCHVPENNIEFDLKTTTSTHPQGGNKILFRIESEGKRGKFSRTLFVNMELQQQTPPTP